MQSSYTYREILTQMDAWKDALQTVGNQADAIQNLWQQGSYQYLIFTGCGSTYYLSQIAASLFQAKLPIFMRAVPASELLLRPESIYLQEKRTLLVTISRSATTTETVQAARNFINQQRGDLMVVSCYGDKPLNDLASLNLVAQEGQELSVVQSRSFSSMLLMIEQCLCVIAGEAVQAGIFKETNFVESALEFAKAHIDPERFSRYFYLGSGARYGLACEASLKMKEMSLTSVEAFHPLEFRHGPKSMVDEQTVVIGLLGKEGFNAEMAVLKEVKALGATVFAIGANPECDFQLPDKSIVYTMPILQALALQQAVSKGLDPDHPRHLEQVVYLDSSHF
jgi:glutamine---fructose-6-phosphate transaminase (isomerizing)